MNNIDNINRCKELIKYYNDCYKINLYILGEKMTKNICDNIEFAIKNHCKTK